MHARPRTVPATRVKLADIAAHLGLDKSSVSLALAGSRKISEKTAARVRQAAVELGYQPNVAARQLRTGGHLAIGLAISLKVLDSSIVVKTIQALSQLALERRVILSILASPCADAVATGQFLPDGLLVWGDIPFTDAQPLCANGRPFVVIDPNNPSYLNRPCPAARFDNAAGATAIVEHLLARGAERLLLVKVQAGHIGHDERCRAARETWLGSRPLHKISSCLLSELSDEHLQAFVADRRGAIFCSNDQGAIAIWHRLSKLGLTPPEKLALAGFDGDPYGEYFGLTTAVVDAGQLATAAFDMLLARMAGSTTGHPLETVIPVELRIGQTT